MMKLLTLIHVLISIFLLGKVVQFINKVDQHIDPLKQMIIQEYSARFCASLATAHLNLKDALKIIEKELLRQNLDHLLPLSREKYSLIKNRLEIHQQEFKNSYDFDCDEIFALGEYILRKEKNDDFEKAWPNWIYQLSLWSNK